MTDPASSPAAALAVAASFTAEPVLPALNLLLGESRLPLRAECAPYHQVFQELLSADSLLGRNLTGVNVVLVRLEDYVRDEPQVSKAREIIERTTRELIEAFRQFMARTKVPTVLALLSPSPAVPSDLKADLEAASLQLESSVRRDLPTVQLIVSSDIDALTGPDKFDSARDELAHIPFTEEYFGAMALVIARRVHMLRVPAHKVLVLDCDNTIWKGVVGEDGVAGITLPEPMLKVQRFAVDQQSRGVLICLVSKNAEHDVLEVFEKRPDMILRAEHIVAHRINWELKSRNLASLARQLNLGLDSFVFIDDNPVECAEVRSALPQITTLQLPADDKIEGFLAHLWAFDKVSVTSEDLQRTRMYLENAARQELENSATDMIQFMAALELDIDIGVPDESQWPRVAQLTQRTNQFNFTTVRRTEAEMRAVQSDGAIVLRVNVRDRFGDYGLVGVVVAAPSGVELVVDSLLLSCRVLGRGVEHAVMRMLGDLARERNLATIVLPYVATPKNEPARAFAESVVAQFGHPQASGIVYRIAAAFARTIEHRPGQDAEAVVQARKSDEKKSVATSTAPAHSSLRSASELYRKMALQITSGRSVITALQSSTRRTRSLPGPVVAPSTGNERALQGLWQELLNIQPIGVDDDYFALGGTSLLAARMFAEIATRLRVKLPLTTILEFTSIRKLAARIEQQAQGRQDVLVPLKSGTGKRNLFLIHDGDGETLLYLNLARRLPAELNVYGVEPLRVTRVPLAHARIEDMAAFYIKCIRKVQPTGPYLLGGLCAGGVIAYEIALQFKRAGEPVELVAILDAAAPGAKKRVGRITKQRVGRLKEMVADLRSDQQSELGVYWGIAKASARKVFNALTWETSQRTARLYRRIRFHVLRLVLSRRMSWPPFMRELTVREIYDTAETHYGPGTSVGHGVVLARALRADPELLGDDAYRDVYADEHLGWRSVDPSLVVIDVEGGHSSMLQEPFVASLASALAPYIAGRQSV
jgi:FkbH-like protein